MEQFKFNNKADTETAYQIITSLLPHEVEEIDKSKLEEIPIEKDMAMAICDYEPPHRSGLAVKKSQIVTILNPKDELWEVETSDGRVGLVPSSILHCFSVIKPSSDVFYQPIFQPRHFPTQEDWVKILTLGKSITYEPGDVIIRKGSGLQRFYQILQGQCIVCTTLTPNEGNILTTLKKDDIFGDINLILGTGSTANVIAHSSKNHTKTTVFMVEGENLKKLFANKRLAGSFYKYLTSVIQQRLRQRKRK